MDKTKEEAEIAVTLDRLVKIPVHEWCGIHYVVLADILEPAQAAFRRALGSTAAQIPCIPSVEKAAYSWDWDLFLERYHRAALQYMRPHVPTALVDVALLQRE